FSCTECDLDTCVQPVAELAGDLVQVRTSSTGLRLGPRAGCRGEGLGRRLGGAHGEVLVDDLVGEVLHALRVVYREDRTGVARGQHPGRDTLLHGNGQTQQADRVADLRARPTDAGGQLLLRHTEVLEQLLIGRCLFERVQ